MSTPPRRRILITGATGFIGRHIAEALLERGDDVRCAVRRPERAAPLAARGMDVVPGDLGDPASLREAASGRDTVVHAAAQVGEWGSRSLFEDANVQGTRHLLDAAEAAGVRRFVHLSSVAVYGRQAGWIDETTPYQLTGDRYTDTKIAAEQVAWERHRQGRLEVSMVRPCVVYGPYDWKFIPRVAQGLHAGRIPLVDRGARRAPIVSVRDVASLLLECVSRPEAAGEAFNCAATESVTWKELFEEVARRVAARPPRFSIPFRVAYGAGAAMEAVYRALGAATPPTITRFAALLVGTPVEYDVSKAERLLGWKPRVSFDAGLSEALAWLQTEAGGGLGSGPPTTTTVWRIMGRPKPSASGEDPSRR